MEFNDRERKMYQWLQQQDAGWPIIRWIIVIASSACLLAYLFGSRSDTVFFIVGLGGLSYTLGSWSGRAEVSLLLKLLNERHAENGKDI